MKQFSHRSHFIPGAKFRHADGLYFRFPLSFHDTAYAAISPDSPGQLKRFWIRRHNTDGGAR